MAWLPKAQNWLGLSEKQILDQIKQAVQVFLQGCAPYGGPGVTMTGQEYASMVQLGVQTTLEGIRQQLPVTTMNYSIQTALDAAQMGLQVDADVTLGINTVRIGWRVNYSPVATPFTDKKVRGLSEPAPDPEDDWDPWPLGRPE